MLLSTRLFMLPACACVLLVQACACALLLSACADDASTPADVPDPIDEALALLDAPWCVPFAERVCAAAATCGCTASPAWPSDCVAYATAQCRRDLRAEVATIDGAFLISTDVAPRCLALVDEAFARCDAIDPLLLAAECRLIVPSAGFGVAHSGDACIDGVCGVGLRCAFDGRCRVPVGDGGPCTVDGDCASPLHCAAGLCATLEPAIGGACGVLVGRYCESGALCQLDSRLRCMPLPEGRCASDHDCPIDSSCRDFGVPRCYPLPDVGETCRDTRRCKSGLACDLMTLSCVTAAGAGEACVDEQRGGPGCASGLHCRQATCLPPGELGEACDLGGGDCVPGLSCRPLDERTQCVASGELGELCFMPEDCTPDAVCALSQTCIARHAEHASCSDGIACVEGLACVAMFPGEPTCERVVALGDTCNGECPVGMLCSIPPADSVCVPPMCGTLRF